MIRYIAHRGNTNGPNPELENRPDYIKKALAAGFDVEIDVWNVLGEWWLGHDQPDYAVDEKFLLDSHFWLHAKHAEALAKLADLAILHRHLNFFYHETDAVTLTSSNFVWTYPTKKPELTTRTVIVMPENDYVEYQHLLKAAGICSDHVANIRAQLPGLEKMNKVILEASAAAKKVEVMKPKPVNTGIKIIPGSYTGLTDILRSELSNEEFREAVRKTIAKKDPVLMAMADNDFKNRLISEGNRQLQFAADKSLENLVFEIVGEQMGVNKSEITRDTHFANDLGADSLDSVELLTEFEDEFELSIPDEEAEKCVTVGQVIDYLKAHADAGLIADIVKNGRTSIC